LATTHVPVTSRVDQRRAEPAAIRWQSALRVRIGLLARLLVFWVLWFEVMRGLFYLWFRRLIPAGGSLDVLRSFWHGARMDLAAAAYLAVLAWLILTVSVTTRPVITRRVLGAYSAFIITLMCLVIMTDIGTFGPWRHRLDGGLWTYLATPKEAYASAASIAVGPLFGTLGVLLVLTFWLYRRIVRKPEIGLTAVRGRQGFVASLSMLGIGALLVIPIRGGLQWTPINESTVFFSSSEFVNTAALNPTWYLTATTIAQQSAPIRNPFVVMPPADAKHIIDSLYAPPAGATPSLLRIAHPNVILIVWESFTAKVVERLGGRPSITPQFDRWSHQGVLFDSVFASGDRSAQGLLAILSGFPSIPNETIMTRPLKAAKLPQLGQTLRGAGYHTSYYYGGELAFSNMKAYVLGGGFDRVTGIESFSATERNSKWGAHDHVVLARALAEYQHEPRPFFSALFTLSSHEPFEVPVAPAFPGTDESTRFLNAHHYTDASIGSFLESASKQPWWDSTLVVIIADHGNPLPLPADGTTEAVTELYHIPLLLVGGALTVRDTVVHRIGASVDLAPTLLAQLGVAPTGFHWGQDLLAPRAHGFAFFQHHVGFAYIDAAGWVAYDAGARRSLGQSRGGGASEQRVGAVLLQSIFADYLAR
jgi:phosphoglycerol transferase MdoB-like AlkP superfamily enzyme